MASTSSEAGLDTFEKVEIRYEHAYGQNPLKKACISKVVSLLSTSTARKILDVGCGTGVPVSQMLAEAGHTVTGIDISPKMIQHATSRVKGTFFVADLLKYEPKEKFEAVFIIFCLLQLRSYTEFQDLMHKYAGAIQPGGYLVIGTMPADNYVTDVADYDETGTWAVNFPTPFMGVMEDTFFLTAKGLVDFITTMGFKVVSNEIGSFQPDDPICVAEDQQYIIAHKTK